MAVNRIEPETAHRPGKRVERSAHVQGLHCHEHTNSRRQAQHERSTPTRRRSVDSQKSSPSSIRAPPISNTYRPDLVGVAVGNNSTTPLIGATRAVRRRRRQSLGAFVPHRAKLTRQACSERPSTP